MPRRNQIIKRIFCLIIRCLTYKEEEMLSNAQDIDKIRLKVCISYNGCGFEGFQSQPSKNTIQDLIEIRLQKLFRRRIVIFGCGRTDAGVHANNAYIHFDLYKTELQKFNESFLKAHLSRIFPVKDTSAKVVVKTIERASNNFDARYSCKRKRYKYNLSIKQCTPFSAPYCWSLTETFRGNSNLDLHFHELNEAIKLLNGVHNFIWLVIVTESEQRSYKRDLKLSYKIISTGNCSLFDEKNEILQFSVETDFFLYRMVRRIVGLLVNILLKKISVKFLLKFLTHFDNISDDIVSSKEVQNEIKKVLKDEKNIKNLSNIISAAPAKGLFLDNVFY